MKKNFSMTMRLFTLLVISSIHVPCNSMTKESPGLIFFHATHEIQGSRSHMEDRHFPYEDKSPMIAEKTAFFGVYDGHAGSCSAEVTAQHMHEAITRQPSFEQGNMAQAIDEGYKTLDEFCSSKFLDGTTAVTALIHGSTLWIANVGDSEAVGFDDEKVYCLTEKHKPTDPQEKQRIFEHENGRIVVFNHAAIQNGFGSPEIKTIKTIETSRGIINQEIYGNADELPHGKFLQYYNPVDGSYSVEDLSPQRPYLEAHHGMLAMSRSIGDAPFKPVNNATPFIQSFTITKPVFLILATDGLWDTMSYNAAVGIVVEHFLKNGLDFSNCFSPEKIHASIEVAKSAAQRLVAIAQELEPQTDNTTASIIFLAPQQ